MIKYIFIYCRTTDIPDPDNSQPHIAVVRHDDYNQYYVAVKRKLLTESTNVATAVFFLLATHYIFNLSYHPKVTEILRFIQEKVAGISSDDKGKLARSPLTTSHINGIVLVHDAQSQDELDTASTLMMTTN